MGWKGGQVRSSSLEWCRSLLCVGSSLLLILAACARSSKGAEDVQLLLRSRDSSHVELVVTNRTDTPLALPADIVNGPRDATRAVFLVARNRQGDLIKRCAVVEVEPDQMRDVTVHPGETVVLTLAVATVVATYCAQQVSLQAEFGGLAQDDRVSARAASNVLDVGVDR
jgi:hypothetical protein